MRLTRHPLRPGFRGRKVVNDYDKGVYNGETGVVTFLNLKKGTDEALQVTFWCVVAGVAHAVCGLRQRPLRRRGRFAATIARSRDRVGPLPRCGATALVPPP